MKNNSEIFEPVDLKMLQLFERKHQLEDLKKDHLEILEDVPTCEDVYPNRPIFEELILKSSIESTYNDEYIEFLRPLVDVLYKDLYLDEPDLGSDDK